MATRTVKVAWDASPSADYYLLRWLTNSREVHGTEAEIDVPDDFAGVITCVAVENGVESGPAKVWFEEFELRVFWDDAHKCIIVSLPTSIERRYVIERSVDHRTWTEFADFPGTGQVEQVGGGSEKVAVFRAWSRAI